MQVTWWMPSKRMALSFVARRRRRWTELSRSGILAAARRIIADASIFRSTSLLSHRSSSQRGAASCAPTARSSATSTRSCAQRHDLSLHEYEVLLVLDGAPGARMRMSDLAAAVVLSQSGLTRLVDRLARSRLGRADALRGGPARAERRAHAARAGSDWKRRGRRTSQGVRRRFLDRFDRARAQRARRLLGARPPRRDGGVTSHRASRTAVL